MSPFKGSVFALLAIISLTTFGAQPVINQALSLARFQSVPDGNYLLTLEMGGLTQRLNLQVQGNRASCTDSSDAKFKDVQGEFQPKDKGVFLAILRGANLTASQIWIFRADGTAAVREVPDRGEQQSAVPVVGATVESPRKK